MEMLKKKLYVGNLDYGITSEQLGQIFSQAGTVVDAVVISDRHTGRSKGFGFVEMSTEEEAQEAVKMFNGTEVEGRAVTVDFARPKTTGI